MKEITGKQKPKLNLLPPENKVDKSIIQNPQNVAKEFNKCFTSVGPKLQKNSPTLSKHFKTFDTL